MKSKFKKKDPKIINFRWYKHFGEIVFREELKSGPQNTHREMVYDDFKQTFLTILNLHAPMKKKFIRGNNAPFMNKTLSQAFMHRSKLKNKFNKNPTKQNEIAYNQQRNYCFHIEKGKKKIL